MSKRILIGDIGSTKGDWAVLDDTPGQVYQTPGFNPLAHDSVQFPDVVAVLGDRAARIDEVYYYGTGVVNSKVTRQIAQRLDSVFPEASIFVSSDILGAARAVYGDVPGIIAILGTGSSGGYYDGSQIASSSPSLGYPIGDEGSGWQIGMALLKGYYYGHMPDDLLTYFAKIHNDSRVNFLNKLRSHAFPNAYLASFATFAGENAGHPWIRKVVSSCFEAFVINHMLSYAGKGPVGCAGGIAWTFRAIFAEVLKTHGMTLGTCVKEPIKGLAEFHKKEL